MPFVKLDCGIIHSSLWAESSDTKICWITLLLLADQNGFVRAAPSAIAREAGIPAEVARKAISLFCSPDNESRSPENQGKRIERIDGGFQILNYEKYRERDYTNAERQKRWRESQKRNVTGVTEALPVTANNTSRSRVQKQNKKEGANGSRPTCEDWLVRLETNPAYKGINVRALHAKMVVWCEVRGLKPTLRRLVTWLNKEDKPMPKHAAAPNYKHNYIPPINHGLTDEQLAVERAKVRNLSAKLREELKK